MKGAMSEVFRQFVYDCVRVGDGGADSGVGGTGSRGLGGGD